MLPLHLSAAMAVSWPTLFSMVSHQISDVDAARIEIYSIETLTLTDQQFLLGANDGTPTRIGGELRLPLGTGSVAAVVLVHGSGGVGANVDGWARELNAVGVAVLILDAFTGREIVQTISDQSQLSSFSLIVDAYRGLQLLAQHPRIDSTRIAVMGFSKGGFAALYSSMKRFQHLWSPADIEFSAYIAFYTRCDTPLLEDENISDHPIRLFHGGADDYVPVAPAQRYVDRLQRAGKDVELTVFEGARHSFDNPLNPPVLSFPEAILSGNCRCKERPLGTILNLDTGKPFSWSDACVTRGATVGYDRQAHEKAIQAVREFLRTYWNLKG